PETRALGEASWRGEAARGRRCHGVSWSLLLEQPLDALLELVQDRLDRIGALEDLAEGVAPGDPDLVGVLRERRDRVDVLLDEDVGVGAGDVRADVLVGRRLLEL